MGVNFAFVALQRQPKQSIVPLRYAQTNAAWLLHEFHLTRDFFATGACVALGCVGRAMRCEEWVIWFAGGQPIRRGPELYQ